MPRGFGRLPFFPRRGAAADGSPSDIPAVADIDPDDAPVGPPVLLPAMIYRQVLVDATDVVPVWARPRPTAPPVAPETAAPTDEAPATKPARRRKSSASSGEPKAPAAPRNSRKPSTSRRRSQ
jgi:hypothetical protein